MKRAGAPIPRIRIGVETPQTRIVGARMIRTPIGVGTLQMPTDVGIRQTQTDAARVLEQWIAFGPEVIEILWIWCALIDVLLHQSALS